MDFSSLAIGRKTNEGAQEILEGLFKSPDLRQALSYTEPTSAASFQPSTGQGM